mmetsp:Transcript_62247/g.103445  ORF Transcript_62247/g.103445 Transcript_62247/m.103445 type:complete len:105 (+) Transcript_62247:166-480(+)
MSLECWNPNVSFTVKLVWSERTPSEPLCHEGSTSSSKRMLSIRVWLATNGPALDKAVAETLAAKDGEVKFRSGNTEELDEEVLLGRCLLERGKAAQSTSTCLKR